MTTGLFGAAILTLCSGCAGLGLPPAAPVSTPGARTTSGTQAATPTPSAATPPTATAQTTGVTTPPSPTASGSTVPDSVARMTGGNGSALPLLIPTSALPTGWTAMPARDTRGYRMTVCDVDLEPVEPVDGAQQNWHSPSGDTFLEQHVRVYPDDTAATVVKALATKIPRCTGYTAKDSSGGQSTFTVEKLTLKDAPEGVVAWRQRVDVPVPAPATAAATATGSPAPTPSATTTQVVQDIAVLRSGASVVLVDAYGTTRDPDDAALVTALKALP